MFGDIVASAGTVVAVGLNLSPGVLFYEFFRGKRQLSSFPEMMFIMGVFCGTTNLAYGFIIDDFKMKLNSFICDSLQVIYSILFLYFYAKNSLMKWLLYSFIALNLTFETFYVFADVIGYHTSIEFADNFTGIFNIFVTIFNSAAPGQNIVKVFQTNNFTLIPIWTTFAQFLCSLLWGIYGFIINNIKVIIPNVIGTILAGIQIFAFFFARVRSGGVPPPIEKEEEDKKDEDDVDNVEEALKKDDNKEAKLLNITEGDSHKVEQDNNEEKEE